MSKDNLCLGKKTENPNKCKKVKGCKVAKGTKRSFCRKAKNVSKKNATKKTTTKKRRTAKRVPEGYRLKGYTLKTYRALKKLM
tara:strand:- start:215 stop:463 length:249 start_codon:yes stop_codon:yes gene_type:complete